MKLIIRGFSQDVDLLNLQDAEAYLVVQNEETEEMHRIPVPGDTIGAIMAIAHGEPASENAIEAPTEEPEEPQEAAPEEEEEELPPPPVQRKRIIQPPAPARRPVARQTPSSEDQVPSV